LKLGAENPKKVALMALLLAAAMFLLWRTLNTPDPQASTAASSQPAARATPEQRQAQRASNTQLANNLDPTLRFELLKPSEETPYRGSGRNIFKPQADPPPVKIPEPVTTATGPIGPPPPPPPPPINLKFFGFANKPGEAKRIFLSQGDDVFVAGEGEIVNRRYRIVRIGPSSVEIEDVLTNHSENIPLTQG
jgi:hypothetical protein